jgi:hypothetical protein
VAAPLSALTKRRLNWIEYGIDGAINNTILRVIRMIARDAGRRDGEPDSRCPDTFLPDTGTGSTMAGCSAICALAFAT